MPTIHPSSIVDPAAQLAEGVEIGPFCTVGPHVRLGAGTKVISHVVLDGHTTIGAGNKIFPMCVIGAPPQDLKWKGEPTRLEVGDNNVIREGVSIHVGTLQDRVSGGVTRLGSNNLLMANMHIGHDCQVGSSCIFANGCLLAGHVHIGDFAVIQGAVGVSHFVTVGGYCFVAGGARISCDVPPFVKVDETGRMVTLNKIRLVRCGYTPEAVDALAKAVRKLVKGSQPMLVTVRQMMENPTTHPDAIKLAQFLYRRSTSKNGRYLESLRSAK
jgi:UDP-N-acetylglucosamine acyltransferase